VKENLTGKTRFMDIEDKFSMPIEEFTKCLVYAGLLTYMASKKKTADSRVNQYIEDWCVAHDVR